jgi:broad specificity phosphatase PhoE
MAKRLADLIATRDVRRVISSPLQRALETARPVAEAFGLELGTDDRLIEASNKFQGLTFGVGDGSLRRPSHWRHLWNPFRPSWGEPYAEIVPRMQAAIDAAREQQTDGEIVLVSHQLPIWTIRSHLEGRRLWHDPRKRQCSLCSLTSLVYAEGRLVEIDYSEPVADMLPIQTGKTFSAGA